MQKTINLKYDTRIAKPYLRQLAKRDAMRRLQPRGLSNKKILCNSELVTSFRHGLSEVAQGDPRLYAKMSATSATEIAEATFH